MSIEEFDQESALAAAVALQEVLQQRTHRRKYLGQVYTVPGKLGEALQLPRILGKLHSRSNTRRDSGVEDFSELWVTLSKSTRDKVLQAIDWYDPKELDWEDKRSNRRPVPVKSARDGQDS